MLEEASISFFDSGLSSLQKVLQSIYRRLSVDRTCETEKSQADVNSGVNATVVKDRYPTKGRSQGTRDIKGVVNSRLLQKIRDSLVQGLRSRVLKRVLKYLVPDVS